MMKKVMKKTLVFGLMIVTLISLCGLMIVEPEEDANDYHDSNMTKVFAFWDRFTDYETGEYMPPDYFGGIIFSDTAPLEFCLTDVSEDTVKELKNVVGDSVLYREVNYSFTELQKIKNDLEGLNEEGTITSRIDIESNSVVVFINDDSQGGGLSREAFDLVNNECYPVEFHSQEVESEFGELNNEVRTETLSEERSATTFYPGQRTRPMSQSSAVGTIGFTARDSSGKLLLFTHGHTYIDELDEDNEYEDVLMATIDGDVYSVYILSNSGNLNELGSVTNTLDAAYIPVTGTITNRINNSSSTKLTGAVYSSQISSVSGITGSYYGYTNGFQTGEVTVSGGILYMYCDTAISSRTGDSGGPIYLTNTSENRLVGIVKSSVGRDTVYGILWTNIAQAYYNCMGKTITVKLS